MNRPAYHWMLLPLEVLSVFSGAKNFQANAVIGNSLLNRWGLHVLRKRAAHVLARRYRKRLSTRLPADQVAAFDAQGFLQLDNFLPPCEFDLLRSELCRGVWPLLEMAQLPAVTHRVNLDHATCRPGYPALARLLENRRLLDWLSYAAGYPGRPLIALQRIASDVPPAPGAADPQTDWHMDTFHSAGKAWLFLHAVTPQDGPFAYAHGSHQATEKRLAWERQQSTEARAHPNPLHARGSFRASLQDLAQMELVHAHVAAVEPNTLVVADTGGLHRRMPSPAPTVRIEVYLSLRRNPYFAWCTPGLLDLPILRKRWGTWAYAAYGQLLKAGLPGWIPLPARGLDAADRAKLGQLQEPGRAGSQAPD